MQIVNELLASRSLSQPTATVGMAGIEARFVDNWGALARVFGMDEAAGRVHATVYLSDGPVGLEEVAARVAMSPDTCLEQLQELVELGVVQACAFDDGSVRFEAERDPWSWFMKALRARGRRELTPVLSSIRQLHELAREASKVRGVSETQRVRLQHIVRFSQFVEQLASMVETVMCMGAGPLMATMKMAGRFLPR
jgi:DNA-binding transcriptional regulator GbsR (MarR family)